MCVLKSDGADGERVPLHETLKFGRALDNDVRVPVARCSRLHAELLTVGESEAVLQNHARAANTTVLRGVPLNPNQARDVKSGDVFEICGRRFRFEAAVAPAPAPAPAPQLAVDVDLTGAPDSDEEEEPEFSPPDRPHRSLDDVLRGGTSPGGGGGRRGLRARRCCSYRCGQRGHWASWARAAVWRPTAAGGTGDVEKSWGLLLCRSPTRRRRTAVLTAVAVVEAVDDVPSADGSSVMRRDSWLFVAAFSFSFMNARISGDRLVGAVRAGDLAGGAGVHARELRVDADVRVVDVDLLRAAEVRQARVVRVRARGRGHGGARRRAGDLGKERAPRGREGRRAGEEEGDELHPREFFCGGRGAVSGRWRVWGRPARVCVRGAAASAGVTRPAPAFAAAARAAASSRRRSRRAAASDSDRRHQTRGSLANRCEIFCLGATSTA